MLTRIKSSLERVQGALPEDAKVNQKRNGKRGPLMLKCYKLTNCNDVEFENKKPTER